MIHNYDNTVPCATGNRQCRLRERVLSTRARTPTAVEIFHNTDFTPWLQKKNFVLSTAGTTRRGLLFSRNGETVDAKPIVWGMNAGWTSTQSRPLFDDCLAWGSPGHWGLHVTSASRIVYHRVLVWRLRVPYLVDLLVCSHTCAGGYTDTRSRVAAPSLTTIKLKIVALLLSSIKYPVHHVQISTS